MFEILMVGLLTCIAVLILAFCCAMTLDYFFGWPSNRLTIEQLRVKLRESQRKSSKLEELVNQEKIVAESYRNEGEQHKARAEKFSKELLEYKARANKDDETIARQADEIDRIKADISKLQGQIIVMSDTCQKYTAIAEIVGECQH